MLQKNNSNRSFGFILLLAVLLFTGCTVYRTYSIKPISEESVSTVVYAKKVIVINNIFERDGVEEETEFVITKAVIVNDSIKGLIEPAYPGKTHVPYRRSFARSKVTAYDPKHTMHIYTSKKEIALGEFAMPISDIKRVEVHEINRGGSLVGTIGVTAAVAVVGTYAVLFATCACPQVETQTVEGTQFHGSLFPGSIFKSLKRKDYLILENYLSDESKLKLKVFNNLPEVEYIDQLGLLEVGHEGFDQLGVKNENQFIAFNKPFAAKTATDGIRDLGNILSMEDEVVYDFNNEVATDELNAVTLQFDRADFADHPYLVIRGKQSEWLEAVANYTFYNIGKSYNNWVKRKDKASGEKWKKKNSRQGVSLNVYLKKDGQWVHIGTHHDAGTLAMRNLLMPLDLKNNTDPTIAIKLESAYKIWEIDYVGLTDDWSADLAVNPIDFTSATDQYGQDVSMNINSADDIYHVQDSNGTFIELEATGLSNQSNTSIVLQGTGYYHHLRDYDHRANLKFVTNINTKLGVQEVSRDLYHYTMIMAYMEEN